MPHRYASNKLVLLTFWRLMADTLSANTARSFWPQIAVAVEKAKKPGERGLLARGVVTPVTLAHANSCYGLLVGKGEKAR